MFICNTQVDYYQCVTIYSMMKLLVGDISSSIVLGWRLLRGLAVQEAEVALRSPSCDRKRRG